MLKPQLIVFGEDWGGLPSSTQHIVKQLADQYRVTWINSLGLRSPKATWHDVKRVFNKAGRIVKQLLSKTTASTQASKILPKSENFTVVEPQYLPILGSQLVRKLNRILLFKLLKKHLKPTVDGNRPVIWISLPNAVDALYHIGQTGLSNPKVIYYCCDDFSSLNGVDHSAVAAFEQELAQQAGLIVATSDALVAKFPKQKTHMIPHGVDTSLFYTPVAAAADLPVGKPIAGFYGSIAGWIDIPLLCQLAQQMSDWNFVMIGSIAVDVSSLQPLDNVYFLGSKPHDQLPSYSQHWDVSLLPFIVNEQIIASNPLKLREYMAAGKPIVSVDFPQVQQYKRFIETASGAQEFADAIRRAHQQSPQTIPLRQQKVAQESWQSVAGKINGLIQAV